MSETEKWITAPKTKKKITTTPQQIFICDSDTCRFINSRYQQLDDESKKIVYGMYLILEASIENYTGVTKKPLEKISIFEIIYPEQAGGALGLSRAKMAELLKEYYDIDTSESSIKRLLNQKLNVSYEDFVKTVIENIIYARKKAVEEEAKGYKIPTSKEDFLARSLIKRMITSMKTANISQQQINRVINEFYRYCIVNSEEHDLKPVAPEWVFDKAVSSNPVDRELVWRRTDNYLLWRIEDLEDRGFEPDINNYKAMLQAVQKWLGARILRPGTTQHEYKGKYQQAEIPLKIREALVMDLLELYDKERQIIYLRIVQSLIILYYTGSRRMILIKPKEGEPRLRIDFENVKTATYQRVIDVYGEDKFITVYTKEKRGISWTKVIPYSWSLLVRGFRLFDEDTFYQATKILSTILKKYINELNEDTQRYLKVGKVWHIWRHTANREALIAFEWNRMIVAKLLGWIKEQNLQIYGDYDIEKIFGLMPEKKRLIFVSDQVKREIEKTFRRAGLI